MKMKDLDTQQVIVGSWVLRCFGKGCANSTRERALRLLEEATEYAQAAGLDESDAARITKYVFGRPVGKRTQELGGVAVTLLAACTAEDVWLGDVMDAEIVRILAKAPSHFTARNNAKAAAGVGTYATQDLN